MRLEIGAEARSRTLLASEEAGFPLARGLTRRGSVLLTLHVVMSVEISRRMFGHAFATELLTGAVLDVGTKVLPPDESSMAQLAP